MMPQDGFAAKAVFRGASAQAGELWERRCAARRVKLAEPAERIQYPRPRDGSRVRSDPPDQSVAGVDIDVGLLVVE